MSGTKYMLKIIDLFILLGNCFLLKIHFVLLKEHLAVAVKSRKGFDRDDLNLSDTV